MTTTATSSRTHLLTLVGGIAVLVVGAVQVTMLAVDDGGVRALYVVGLIVQIVVGALLAATGARGLRRAGRGAANGAHATLG